MIKYKCERCGSKVTAPDIAAGKESKCPSCTHIQAVPVQAKVTGHTESGGIPKSIYVGVVSLFLVAVIGLSAILMLQSDKSDTSKDILGEQPVGDPSIKANISGGAWIIRAAGNSDQLRGLKIFALNPRANTSQLRNHVNAAIKAWQGSLDIDRKQAQYYKTSLDEHIAKNSSAEIISLYRDSYTEWLLRAEVTEQQLNRAKEIYNNSLNKTEVDLNLIYKLRPVNRGIEPSEASSWANIIADQKIASAQTDVDGKYVLELKGGRYYLFAEYKTQYSDIEWFIPITIDENGEIKQDFFNDTASIIKN